MIMNELPCIYALQTTSGKGRGNGLGIPTINFRIPNTISIPYGIYAGYLIVEKKKFKAAIHFGPRPQFEETDPSLEAYILEGKVSINSINLQLEFIKYIRVIRSFSTVNEMLQRIEVDIKEVEEILNTT